MTVNVFTYYENKVALSQANRKHVWAKRRNRFLLRLTLMTVLALLAWGLTDLAQIYLSTL